MIKLTEKNHGSSWWFGEMMRKSELAWSQGHQDHDNNVSVKDPEGHNLGWNQRILKTADSAVIMRNMTTADFREPYGQLFAHDRQELVTATATELHRTMRMAEGSVP
jgi:hypothetical protein